MNTIPTHLRIPENDNKSVIKDHILIGEEAANMSPDKIIDESTQRVIALIASQLIEPNKGKKSRGELMILEVDIEKRVKNAVANFIIGEDKISTMITSTRFQVIQLVTKKGYIVTQGEYEGDILFHKDDAISPATTESPVEPTEF